jgi:hypothetical protein
VRESEKPKQEPFLQLASRCPSFGDKTSEDKGNMKGKKKKKKKKRGRTAPFEGTTNPTMIMAKKQKPNAIAKGTSL